MSEQFNNLLKRTYIKYKNKNNPPIPLREIKEYLEFEGIDLTENCDSGD